MSVFLLALVALATGVNGKAVISNAVDDGLSQNFIAAAARMDSNLNGCTALSTHCRSECVHVDPQGCPVCSCPDSAASTSLTHSSTGKGSSRITSGNNNGCKPFPKSCHAECTKIDDIGCIICDCSGVQSSSQSISAGSGSSSGSSGNNNGCSAFPRSCQSECMKIDDRGCIVCECSGMLTNTTSSGQTGSNSGVGFAVGVVCPQFNKNCDPACIGVDSVGCIVCSCSGPSPNNVCPAIPQNCPSSCLTINAETGCVLCSCAGETGTTTEAPVVCPQLYVGDCHSDCLGMDVNGCVICTCSATAVTPVITVAPTQTPATSARPTVTPSATGTGSNGACPPFGIHDCDAACVEMDRMGCLSCKCFTALPGRTTQSPSSGGKIVPGICAPFNINTCDPACVTVHDNGCFSCECGSGNGTVAPSATPSNGGVNVHPGGCPSFDPMTCAADCVKMDDHGCMSCTCTTGLPIGPKTPSPSSDPSGGGNVHPGGCPSFDPMTCSADCVKMDDRGCMSCTCSSESHTNQTSTQPSTAAPLVTKTSTQAPVVTQTTPRASITTKSPTHAPTITNSPIQEPISTRAPVLTPEPTDNHALCPPVRCTAPCNLGIEIDKNGCPKCKCSA